MPIIQRTTRKGTPISHHRMHSYQDSSSINTRTENDPDTTYGSIPLDFVQKNKVPKGENTNNLVSRDYDLHSNILLRDEDVIGKRIASFLSLGDVDSIVSFYDRLEHVHDCNDTEEDPPDRNMMSRCLYCAGPILNRISSFDSAVETPGLPIENIDCNNQMEGEFGRNMIPLSSLFDNEDEEMEGTRTNYVFDKDISPTSIYDSADNIPDTVIVDSDEEEENDLSSNAHLSSQSKIICLKNEYSDQFHAKSSQEDLAALIFSTPLSIRSCTDIVVSHLLEKSKESSFLHDSNSAHRHRHSHIFCTDCEHYRDAISPEVLREPDAIEVIAFKRKRRLRDVEGRIKSIRYPSIHRRPHSFSRGLAYSLSRLLFQVLDNLIVLL